jgi:hypothetical protein
MKAILEHALNPRRGDAVNVGNVYSNQNGRPFYKVVVGIAENDRYNRVICLHVAATGKLQGCSMQPMPYLSNHNDLVGRAIDLPDFKIEWFKCE